MKVLLVEDCSILTRFMTRNLKLIGITEVTQASDGNAGWRAFSSGEFDLVLTDWNMPGLSGLELLQAIRQAGHETPVIMVTSEDKRGQVREAAKLGVSDYLCKPFTQQEFWDKIDRFILTEA